MLRTTTAMLYLLVGSGGRYVDGATLVAEDEFEPLHGRRSRNDLGQLLTPVLLVLLGLVPLFPARVLRQRPVDSLNA